MVRQYLLKLKGQEYAVTTNLLKTGVPMICSCMLPQCTSTDPDMQLFNIKISTDKYFKLYFRLKLLKNAQKNISIMIQKIYDKLF